MHENGKIISAKKALEFIEDNMILGIGSGSTVKYFIRFLAENIKKGYLRGIKAIPSSYDTRIMLHKLGIECVDLLDCPVIDITIDGADAVYFDKSIIIKGGGGAFLREKIIGYAAKEFIIIVDESKVGRRFPVPVEVLPFGLGYAVKKLGEIGEEIRVRECKGKLGPCISDNGNIIVDVLFDESMLSPGLEKKLNMIPGVLENGIFTRDAKIIVGSEDGNVTVSNL